MGIDWKLWLVIGGLGIGLLAQLGDLLVCHWLPTTSGRAFCGAIVAEASTFGTAAKLVGTELGGGAGPGAPDAGAYSDDGFFLKAVPR